VTRIVAHPPAAKMSRKSDIAAAHRSTPRS